MQPWFKSWFNSPYYHMLYAHRDENEAARFINHLIDILKPPPGSTMLDVACGKGRHALQLFQKGFDVTGTDLSEESIRQASMNETDSLHFYVHDMRKLFRINYYDYVFNFFTSFGYFNNDRENGQAIGMMSQALQQGGTLVLDYLNPSVVIQNLKPQESIERGNVRFDIIRWFDDHFFYKKITVHDHSTEQQMEFEEKVANISLERFKELFYQQGLTLMKVYGDYSFAPYEEATSPRLLMLAVKNGNG